MDQAAPKPSDPPKTLFGFPVVVAPAVEEPLAITFGDLKAYVKPRKVNPE